MPLLSRNLFVVICYLVLGVLAQATQAAVVNYSESVNGELPSNATPGPLFILDTVGVHIWNGSSFRDDTDAGARTEDLDWFKFDVTAGLRLTSVEFSTSNLVNENWVASEYALRIQAGTQETGPLEYGQVKDVIGSDPNYDSFYSDLPLNPGTYLTSLVFAGFNPAWCPSGVECSASWEWTVAMTVDSSSHVVPIPAAVWLFGSAMLGLGLIGQGTKKCRRS